MVDLRTELCEVEATKSVLERESHTLLLQLHSSQLQLHSKAGSDADSDAIKKKLVSTVVHRVRFRPAALVCINK